MDVGVVYGIVIGQKEAGKIAENVSALITSSTLFQRSPTIPDLYAP